jgi:hypothetical protein
MQNKDLGRIPLSVKPPSTSQNAQHAFNSKIQEVQMTITGKTASAPSCFNAGLFAGPGAGWGHINFADALAFLAHCRNPPAAISTKSRRKGEAPVNGDLISRHSLFLETRAFPPL